jgi:hypothetical protein
MDVPRFWHDFILAGLPGQPGVEVLDPPLGVGDRQEIGGGGLSRYDRPGLSAAGEQQMRWSRRGADLLLQVRCAVLNAKLGSGFGQLFKASPSSETAMAA